MAVSASQHYHTRLESLMLPHIHKPTQERRVAPWNYKVCHSGQDLKSASKLSIPALLRVCLESSDYMARVLELSVFVFVCSAWMFLDWRILLSANYTQTASCCSTYFFLKVFQRRENICSIPQNYHGARLIKWHRLAFSLLLLKDKKKKLLDTLYHISHKSWWC